MSVTIKHKLKSWMLVYVGFVLALTAANTDVGSKHGAAKQGAAVVSPGTLPSASSIEQTFFRPTVAEPRRNDI